MDRWVPLEPATSFSARASRWAARALRAAPLAGRAEALGDRAPIDRVPPGVEVVGPLVLVLEVVGVLPHIHSEQRRGAEGDRVVLVGRADDRELRSVVHEPRPAGAEP